MYKYFCKLSLGLKFGDFYYACETFQLLNGKGINAEFPSNKPNRIKKLFPCCSSRKHRVDHRYTGDFVFIHVITL